MAGTAKTDSEKNSTPTADDYEWLYALQGSLSGLPLEADLEEERSRARAIEDGVAYQRQVAILDLFGKIDFDEKYDHRSRRKRSAIGHGQ